MTRINVTSTGTPVQLIHTLDAHAVPCYFVLRSSQGKLAMLRAKLGKEPVDIADYGEVLASGYGEKPHRSLRQQLQEQYHITFDA